MNCRKCRKQYVGKSETPLNKRLNNHRSHTKHARSDLCELAAHVINNANHDFQTDITIMPIEQIKNLNFDNEKKKEILKKRERFWIKKLKSFQPFGINKRFG